MIHIVDYKYNFYHSKKEILQKEKAELTFNIKDSTRNNKDCLMPWSKTGRRNRLYRYDGYFLLISEFIDQLENKLSQLYECNHEKRRTNINHPKYYIYNNKLLFTVSFKQQKIHTDNFFEQVKELTVEDTTFKLNNKILKGHTKNTIGNLEVLYYEV